eukprot:PhF_6_TR20227/c0_g1_i1/m.29296
MRRLNLIGPRRMKIAGARPTFGSCTIALMMNSVAYVVENSSLYESKRSFTSTPHKLSSNPTTTPPWDCHGEGFLQFENSDVTSLRQALKEGVQLNRSTPLHDAAQNGNTAAI